MMPQEKYSAFSLCVCVDHVFSWHGPHFLSARNMHVSCNLPCAMQEIYGVTTRVTAMQRTRLGKYLTMPNVVQNCNKIIPLLTQ